MNIINVLKNYPRERLIREENNNNKVAHILAGGMSLNYSIGYVYKIGGDCIATTNYLTDRKENYPDIVGLCIADVTFIKQNIDISQNQIEASIKSINGYDKKFTVFSQLDLTKSMIKNENAIFKRVNYNPRRIDEVNDYTLLERNIISPVIATTTVLAIYVAIQLGYKEIYIHGFDMDYLKTVEVDVSGQAYLVQNHFADYTKYDNYRIKTRVLDELRSECSVLEGVYLLKQYADKMGVKLVNMSKNSLIDELGRFDY